MLRIRSWFATEREIVSNTLSLVASTLATSGLGFAFWFLAAKLFHPENVGLASAAVAAMLMLSTLGIMGLDALLVGELGRNEPGSNRNGLISAGVIAGFVTSGLLAVLFALVAGAASAGGNLSLYFRDGWGAYVVFAVGAGLSGCAWVFDRATIGLLRGKVQLVRNVVFAALKLALIPVVAWWVILPIPEEEALYGIWALAALVSLVVVIPGLTAVLPKSDWAPDWRALWKLRGSAWSHHLVNLGQHGPNQVLPVVVAALVMPDVNAAFYVAWMLASLGLSVPWHLTMVLHAIGSRDVEKLAEKLRVTLKLSVVAAVAIAAGTELLADPFLTAFGPHYAELAEPALRILALSVLPVAVKAHYFALARILGFTRTATWVGALGGTAELVAVYFASQTGSLTVLTAVLVAVLMIEGVVLLPTVLRFARPRSAFIPS